MSEEQENENSVDRKPCINRESKSDDITIKLYSCQYINMKFLAVVTPPSIYQVPWRRHRRFLTDGKGVWRHLEGGI